MTAISDDFRSSCRNANYCPWKEPPFSQDCHHPWLGLSSSLNHVCLLSIPVACSYPTMERSSSTISWHLHWLEPRWNCVAFLNLSPMQGVWLVHETKERKGWFARSVDSWKSSVTSRFFFFFLFFFFIYNNLWSPLGIKVLDRCVKQRKTGVVEVCGTNFTVTPLKSTKFPFSVFFREWISEPSCFITLLKIVLKYLNLL